jgi:uncharacterized protein YbjT (DUF2867 family)
VDVLLFGASGMVGQGVLRECLLSPDVRRVVSVGRTRTGVRSEKLEEVVVPDLKDLSALTDRVPQFDAAFFCVGVSSLRMSESEYSRLTFDLTMAVAEPLARRNPRMTFVYVSGAGTDSTEQGRSMWARVKGRTENALLRLPFRNAFLFRPGAIQPLHGVRSKTPAYRLVYIVLRPFLPLLLRAAPGSVTTTERVGRAMIRVARDGAPSALIDNRRINALGR